MRCCPKRKSQSDGKERRKQGGLSQKPDVYCTDFLIWSLPLSLSYFLVWISQLSAFRLPKKVLGLAANDRLYLNWWCFNV